MRRFAILALILLGLAGCSRPMAPGERAFARDLFGDTLNRDRVRVAVGLGLAPVPRPKPPAPVGGPIELRPGICDRVAPDTGPPEPPPAFALFDRVHVMPEWYHADMMPDWPRRILVPEALIFAHELVHVWQWQNRRRTGYHPVRAAFEGLVLGDPYFYRPNDGEGFLGFGYEQQGALVEDYMCYLIFDPKNPRRAEIHDILAPYLSVDRLDRAAGR